MALDKSLVLEKLKKVYPDGVIYKEAYTPKAVTTPVHYSIHAIARSEGKTDSQWLTDNGFIWRKTGYCEAEMKTRDIEWKADSPAMLADSILRRYPLIGQYELTDAEFSTLFSAATDVMRKSPWQRGARPHIPWINTGLPLFSRAYPSSLPMRSRAVCS